MRFNYSSLGALLSICCTALPANAASLVITGGTTIGIYNFAGKASPSWTSGGLVALESETSAEPVVHLFNAAGQEVRTMYFTIPGARVIGVRGSSAGADGAITLCGWTQDGEGHLGQFLAIAPANASSPIKIVRTDPYAPHAVTMSPDGTIWTKGIYYNPSKNALDRKLAGGVIRHFDGTGKPIGSFIPQSSLSLTQLVAGLDVLVSSADRIGWYQGGSDSYFEVLTDGTVQRYATAAKNISGMLDLAMTNGGEVFVSIPPPPPGSGTAQIYSLNRSGSTWKLAQWPSGAGLLLGASGDGLVAETPVKPQGLNLQFIDLR